MCLVLFSVVNGVDAAVMGLPPTAELLNEYGFNLNTPIKRFYPAGHWYEIPNLILNGTLGRMLKDNPNLSYLLVHNADTLGADLDPVILEMHIGAGSPLSFEVLPLLWGDRGGVLARVDGRHPVKFGFIKTFRPVTRNPSPSRTSQAPWYGSCVLVMYTLLFIFFLFFSCRLTISYEG